MVNNKFSEKNNPFFKVLGMILPIFILFLFQNCSKNDSEIVSPSSSNFEIPKTEDVIMYEINPTAFSASKDIQGITNRLDNLKALGINTIWIMPIYPVGILNSFGSPYCVKDYKAVNPSLGTLSDLKNLVTKAHEKKIAVLLDWVANHTSWDNNWISNTSWYSQNANGTIISPAGTNWNDVADLNYSNAQMRLAMIDAMNYWIKQADIDGFRCDAADFVPFDFWQQAITALQNDNQKKLLFLAEGSRQDHFSAGFQINFAWDYLSSLKSTFVSNQDVGTIFTTNLAENNVVPLGKRKLRFTTNHDESNIATPITVFGSQNAALAASVITIYLQGVPLLYCGQEVGISSTSVYNSSATINWSANSYMLNEYTKLLNFYAISDASKKGILQNFSNFDCAVFEKSIGNEKVLILVNTRSTNKTVAISAAIQGNWKEVFSNNSVTLGSTLNLNPYQYLVLKN